MPVFYQHVIDEDTRLGIWKIEETEQFFLSNVPVNTEVSHPHKRLQHLAGRFLLRFLFPGFPYELIRIADTRKPFLANEEYHFSISHCGDYAAAIVSRSKRVGIDIEIPSLKIERIKHKFLNEKELAEWAMSNKQLAMGNRQPVRDINPQIVALQYLTLLWSAKEAVFKWYGDGGVDFSEHTQLGKLDHLNETFDCYFSKNDSHLSIHYKFFEHLVLAWVVT
jgi:4'-phosphopantetheinyl transferase